MLYKWNRLYSLENAYTLDSLHAMKKTLTLLALTAALMPMMPHAAKAETKTYWVTGVNSQDGWFDAEKDTKGGSGSRSDKELCWAASSSNIIAWWQEQQDYVPEKTAPTELDKIWNQYRDTFANVGGHAELGLHWWLDGSYEQIPLLTNGLDPKNGGYYAESLVPTPGYKSGVLRTDLQEIEVSSFKSDVRALSESLVSYINAGYGVELTWALPDSDGDGSTGGHSVTLWGVDYSEQLGRITNFYITDSDDYKTNSLTPVQINVSNDIAGNQTLSRTKYGDVYTLWSFTVLNSRLSNDYHYFNILDEESGNIIMKQSVEGSMGYTLKAETQEVKDIIFDGSRGAVERKLKVEANKSVEAINVEARQGTNFVDVQQGVTLTADEVIGSGTLTKTGQGKLKVSSDSTAALVVKDGVLELCGAAAATTAAITVDGGTLLCENGTLGEVTLSSGGTLHGSGKYKNVTVNGGTLSVGNSPGQQKFTDHGVLTLSQATLEFYVAGWRYASSLDDTGWSSGTYSNIDMSGANKLDVQSIDSIIFYVGGDALKALSTRNTLTLDIVDGINSYNFLLNMLEDMAANTKFIVAEGAPNDTNWQAGQDITQYINFEYRFNDNSWMYMPNSISLVGSFTGATPPAVPEPATSTLSLLALAGLCARRRRK